MGISGVTNSDSSQINANYGTNESTVIEKQQQSDFVDSLMISEDKDSDGILTLEESGLSKKEFAKLDADGNDRITPAEVQAVLEKLQKEKGELGKLDVQMQQAAESSPKAQGTVAQGMVNFEDSGLDEDVFKALDSDGDGKVSKEAADLLRVDDKEGGEDGVFAEALPEYQKSFFKKKDEDEDKDLNKDGVVSVEEEEQAEQQAAQVAGVNTEESKEPATDNEPQGRRFSARQMAGVRAYQNQASEFFASASKSSVSFQY